MKKKANLIVVLLLCIVIFSSCGLKNRAKSVSDIRADIMQNDSSFADYKITIDDVTITKRQTNIEDKVDFVWAEVKGHSDEVSWYSTYEITYVLYNDGWYLDDFDTTDVEYSTNTIPDEKLINSTLESFFAESNDLIIYPDDVTFVDKECISNREYSYNYIEIDSKSFQHLTISYLISIDFNYYLMDGWKVADITKTMQSMELDSSAFLGKWKSHLEVDTTDYWDGYKMNKDFLIDIKSIDINSMSYQAKLWDNGVLEAETDSLREREFEIMDNFNEDLKCTIETTKDVLTISHGVWNDKYNLCITFSRGGETALNISCLGKSFAFVRE